MRFRLTQIDDLELLYKF